MALLIVSGWLGLYAGQMLIRAALDFIGASVVGGGWVLVLWAAALAVGGAWFVGLWRGLAGRGLALATVVSSVVVLVIWQVTMPAVAAILPVSLIETSGEAATVLSCLLFALLTAGVAWLTAGVLVGFDLRRTGAAR